MNFFSSLYYLILLSSNLPQNYYLQTSHKTSLPASWLFSWSPISTLMADFDHSSDATSVDSSEGSSQDFKLEFSEDEEFLIIRMFNLVGERWSLIAGRIPGRTAEEIEKYWTSRYSTSE